MASLIKLRPGGERRLLAFRSSSSRTASSSGSKQTDGSGNKSEGRGERTKSENVVMKPWADQPWPLIEAPSRTQNVRILTTNFRFALTSSVFSI